jgi:uncharacterized membrane-anchored protein YjiN (DUF445 family)
LTVMVESDREQRMLDAALQLAQSLLEDYSQIVERTVELEMPWYVPRFMQHRLFKRIAFGLKGRLEAINADALHPVRRKFYDDLRELCRRLRESPEYARRGEALKHRLLGPTSRGASMKRLPRTRSIIATFFRPDSRRLAGSCRAMRA